MNPIEMLLWRRWVLANALAMLILTACLFVTGAVVGAIHGVFLIRLYHLQPKPSLYA